MSTEQAALALAEEYGLPVFPCRAADELASGKVYKAKTPYTAHGFKDASCNFEQIGEWWRRWPEALIGVPTGRASKLLVVDIDPAGLEWYRANAGRLAPGRTHKTPRGFHLLYRMPDADIRNSTGTLAPGVDVRAEGGYIIWWPAHGHEVTGDLADLALPVLPAPPAGNTSQGNGRDAEGIREGGRNDFLSREGYRLRRLGSSVEQTLIVLRAINEARCIPPLADAEIVRMANGKAGVVPDSPPAPTIELRHIADIVAERREPQWLKGLHKILERNVLAVLAGSRNTFKSFIAHHWVMTAAINAEPVVILSAEGAGLDRRTDAWMRTHAPAIDLRTLAVIALERAVNLNASATIEALRQAIDARQMTPAIILVDTYSKYAPGLDENDNAEVALYLSVLSGGLRHYYGSTVLLVAHAGHADARRPRGASVLMANPDCEYIVERPDPTAMTATVTRERFKDCAALPPLAYEAQVIDLGRLDSYADPVTSLVLRDADLPAAIAARKPELHGRAQRQLLAALRAQGTNGVGIWTLADIREIGRKAGLNKSSARSAAEALTFTPYLTASVGGWHLEEAEG